MSLSGKCVVVGVTGGIAAYKSADLVSKLIKQHAEVHVIMTHNATQFIAPLTFQTLSHQPVICDTFDRPERWEVEHVALAKKADAFIIAPATANVIAKITYGIADDMLSTTILATKAPVLIAPAMNTNMWTAEITQQNVSTLRARGFKFVGPGKGILACGDNGDGRMSEPAEIVEAVCAIFDQKKDLEGLRLLVTAGATRERLDPVRFLSNDSSGKMGFAIAEAARDRGAEVTIVRGITTASQPTNVSIVPIESTMDLYNAMMDQVPKHDIVIQAAAPADYRFQETYPQKLKKQNGQPLIIELIENPDVAAAVGKLKKPGQTFVGFAAETENLLQNAKKKLDSKHLDLIVANDVSKPGAGFNTDTNIATLIDSESAAEYPLRAKRQLADDILDKIISLRNKLQ